MGDVHVLGRQSVHRARRGMDERLGMDGDTSGIPPVNVSYRVCVCRTGLEACLRHFGGVGLGQEGGGVEPLQGDNEDGRGRPQVQLLARPYLGFAPTAFPAAEKTTRAPPKIAYLLTESSMAEPPITV